MGVINRFFLYTTALASASLLTAAWIVDGVSFRVADLARSVIILNIVCYKSFMRDKRSAKLTTT